MRHARRATGFVALATAIAGCGGGEDYANDPRPPSPINVTAAITQEKITVSPREIGAGPVVMIIANQTEESRRVTVETDVLGAAEGGIKQSTAPINPRGTATLKIDIRPGRYTVTAGDGVDDARLKVGKERDSAQDELLQP